ncbi:unnamed protein product [Somion occarium]|uniref:Uncharacterized protein n=1 Tax=Somion occarium TaxID=3059160 RepID=A0ABP1E334_9APHY
MSEILLVLFLQLSFLTLCVLEESLETSSILKSPILSDVITLSLDVTISLCRISARFLSCFGFCNVSSLTHARLSYLSHLREMGICLDSLVNVTVHSLPADNLSSREERTRLQNQLARAHSKLSQAQSDLSKLRRTYSALETNLAGIRSEHSMLLETVEALRNTGGNVSVVSGVKHTEKLSLCNNLTNRGLQLQNMEYQTATTVGESGHFCDSSKRCNNPFMKSQAPCSSLTAEQDNVQCMHQAQILDYKKKAVSFRQHFVQRDAKHIRVIHQLSFFLLLLWQWSHVLRTRSTHASTTRTADILWKRFADQKLEAGRERMRALVENIELKDQLLKEVEIHQDDALVHRYHRGEYRLALRLCQEASTKFRKYRRYALGRYSQTVTRLLAGLLVLWRFNMVLARELTEAKAMIRALETTAADTSSAEPSSDDPNEYDHIPSAAFSRLPRIEAAAVYVNLCRKYDHVQADYHRFVESCTQASASKVKVGASEELTSSLQELQTAYENLISEHSEALDSLDRLKAEVESRDQSLSDLQKQSKQLEGHRRSLEEDLQTARELLRISHDQRKEVEEQLSAVRERIEQAAQDLCAKDQAYQDKDGELTRTNETISYLQSRVEALDEEMQDLLRNSEMEVTRLQHNFEVADQKFHSCEGDVARLLGQLTDSENAIRVADTQRQQDEGLLRKAQDVAKSNDVQRQRLEAQCLEANYKLREAGNTVDSLTNLLASSKKRIVELEALMESLSKDLDVSRATALHTATRVTELEQQLQDSERIRRTLSQELDEASRAQTAMTMSLADSTIRYSRRSEAAEEALPSSKHEFLTSRLVRLQATVRKLEGMDRWYLDALFRNQDHFQDAQFLTSEGDSFAGQDRVTSSSAGPSSGGLSSTRSSGPPITSTSTKSQSKRLSGGVLCGIPRWKKRTPVTPLPDTPTSKTTTRQRHRRRAITEPASSIREAGVNELHAASSPSVVPLGGVPNVERRRPTAYAAPTPGGIILRRSASSVNIADVLPDDDIDVFRLCLRAPRGVPSQTPVFTGIRKDVRIQPNDSGMGLGVRPSSNKLIMPRGIPPGSQPSV